MSDITIHVYIRFCIKVFALKSMQQAFDANYIKCEFLLPQSDNVKYQRETLSLWRLCVISDTCHCSISPCFGKEDMLPTVISVLPTVLSLLYFIFRACGDHLLTEQENFEKIPPPKAEFVLSFFFQKIYLKVSAITSMLLTHLVIQCAIFIIGFTRLLL